MQLPSGGLNDRLVLVLLLGIAFPLIGLSGLFLLAVRKAAFDDALEDRALQAQFRARFIENTLLEPVINTLQLSENALLRQYRFSEVSSVSSQRIEATLERFIEDRSYLRLACILNAAGEVQLAHDRFGTLSKDALVRFDRVPVIASAMNSRYPVAIQMLTLPGTPERFLGFFREIRNSESEIVAILMLAFSVDLLAELPAFEGRSWVLDASGIPLNELGEGIPDFTLERVMTPDILRSPQTAAFANSRFGQLIVTSSRIHLPASVAPHWTLVDVIPARMAVAGERRTSLIIATLGLAMVGLSFGVAAYVVRRTVRPLRHLAGRVERMGEQDWASAEGLPVERQDEVGHFSRAFVQMSRQLDTAFKRLKELNQRLSTSLNAIGDGILLTDAKGKIRFANPAASRITGLKADAARGFDISVVLPEFSDEPVAYEGTDGTTRWLLIYKADMESAEGHSIGSVYTVRDVTTEQTIQANLGDALETAQSASRSKSRFMASINAELQGSLQSIHQLSEQLLQDADSSLDRTAAIEGIRHNCLRQLNLIEDILDFFALEEGQLSYASEAFSPEALIDDLMDFFTKEATMKGLTLRRLREGPLPSSFCSDGHRIRQVLRQLLQNAIKFTPSGSVILRTHWDLQKLHFQVEDTGVGISPSNRQRIFEPFAQDTAVAPQPIGGAGIGLTLARGLALGLNAELRLEAPLSKGSCFSFIVPSLMEEPSEDA